VKRCNFVCFHLVAGSAEALVRWGGKVSHHLIAQWHFSAKKHLSQVLSRRPLQLCQIRCTSVHGELLGEWVKYNQSYLICTILRNSPTGQTRRRIFTHDGSKLAQGCAFLGFVHMAPYPTNSSWVVPTHASPIQDGGRPPPWKNRKIAISRPRYERFLAQWRSSTFLAVPTVKNV